MKRAGFLLTKQDKENNAIVKELVKNHFGLDKDSLEYFNEQIDNPKIDDVYFNAFEKAGSSKIEFDMPSEIQEKLDYGWQSVIKTSFSDFIADTGVTYENFKSNKVEIKKNFFKLKKAIVNYYIEKIIKKIDEGIKSFEDGEVINYSIEDFSYMARNFFSYDTSSAILITIKNYIYKYVKSYLEGEEELANTYKKEIISTIESTVDRIWSEAASSKLSSDNLKIVITFSFADMFLCSTNESWGSCLALTGNSANYWYGLPGLIGDKNRVMIYITRGDEKEYHGIKTHHYLYRTWALLDDKNRVNVVRWFPREDLHNKEMVDFLQKKTGLYFNEISISNNYDFYSKHQLRLIYSNDGYSLFPYQDYTDWTEGNETYIISGDSGMFYKKKGSYYGSVLSDEVYSYDCFSSLGDLIERNTNICEASSGERCEDCGSHIEFSEVFVSSSGENLCHSCFHENYFECIECREVHHIDYSFYTEDGLVCEDCFHDNYFIDELDSKTYPLEEAVSATDDRNGNYEFLTNISNVEERGYIYNEDDGIYYKPQYMVEIDGKWIHKDVAEEGQLEIGLAV